MTRTIFLTLTLLGCTAWVAAQTTSSSSSQTGSTSSQNELSRKQAGSQSNTGQNTMGNESSTGMNGNKMTLTGCLSGSAGNYMLTDASGTKYQLEGDASKLSSEVNNQVEVKGTASGSGMGSASSSSSGTNSSASGTTGNSAGNRSAETFNVSSVKRISSSCTSGGK